MNTRFRSNAVRLVAVALLAACWETLAVAQYMDPAFGPPSQGMSAALPSGPLHGPIWLRYTPTPDGLGFDRSYTTLGALIPVWNSSGDALWFLETQGHVSGEGRFFGNLGVGRRIYESGMRRTFGLSAWFDYDGDRYETFGHDFYQGGVTFDSFGDVVDFHINGYFPIQEEYVLGPSTPGFFQNNIMLLQGIDAALRGTDVEAGVRLPWVPMLDPRAYVGGYYYGSSSVDPFLGLSARMEIQPSEWTTAQVRVTDDERFGTSVMFGLELHMGGRRHRPAFDRMTEPVHRNDHIVRFHQDPLFAINPNTGLPYRVVHVYDREAAFPGPTGAGTFEQPFRTLLEAQAASIPHDIVLVYGGRTTNNAGTAITPANITYGGGIVLKDFQRLIGTGSPLVLRNGVLTVINAPDIAETSTVVVDGIPRLVRGVRNNNNTANFFNNPLFLTTGLPTGALGAGDVVVDTTGTVRTLSEYQVLTAADTFQTGDILISDITNANPTLSNPGGASVTLANFNEVANLQITNSRFGIAGNGVTGFNLHDNDIIGTAGSDGVVLDNVFGSGLIRNNRIVSNARPNPPVTPNVPFNDGVRISVTGASSADIDLIGNVLNDNDTGATIISTTSGVARFDFSNNFANSNVNDGIAVLGAGPGTLITSVTGTGTVVDNLTGLTPTITGTTPGSTVSVLIQAAQASLNGDIAKVTNNNGNGRGYFADVLDGNYITVIDGVTFDGNDSSFFPRYGAVQFNLEPAVDAASIVVNNNSITRTGLHVTGNTNIIGDDSIDAGSGIRLVSNPGFGVTHRIDITNNDISFNFSDGIKLLMLTEGIRTAALPQGTLVANVRNNSITSNRGISDDDGGVVTLTSGLTVTYNQTDVSDDFDSPTASPLTGAIAASPFQGFNSNPDPKNEFTNNINGSGIVVRAKGTNDSRMFLNIQDNTITNNAYDAINMAFAGRGNVDYVLGTAGQLTPVQVYTPIVADPITGLPIGAQSPDAFGVNAVVVIDNNVIIGGPANIQGTIFTTGVSDDLIKITMMDGSDVALQISNNRLASGGGLSGLTALTPSGFPAGDAAFDTAIEIDTYDTSRLMFVADNNDIQDSGIFNFNDGGIDLRSHHNSIMAVRLTRNRINQVNDSNNLSAFGGAGINLLAEGNSTMVAFVNNNDLFNSFAPFGSFIEATTADTARLSLQLLDNNAQSATSNQGNQSFGLTGDAFYLVQTENSVFELEPTRGTNHEQNLPESESVRTYTLLLIAPPGAILPASTDVQFGNVATGTTQVRLNALFSDFPFTPNVIGFSDFDPPVTHP